MRVVIAGGGVAGLETLLALRDLAGDRVALSLITPEAAFAYRPMAVGEPFGRGRAQRIALGDVTGPTDAALWRGRLASIDLERRVAVAADGNRLEYDALVVATGAGSTPAVEHASTWTPESDADVLGGLLRDLEEGYTRSVAFVVPPGVAWPLPAYELALMTAWDARDMGRDDVEVTVHTHEPAPLAVFGSAAASALEADLADAGVRVVTDERVTDGAASGAQRVVALPVAVPNRPDGLPSGPGGFVPVDRHGRVEQTDGVWAAGDVIDFPVKQGGLAAQQADAVAESVAAEAGASVTPRPFRPVLRGVVLSGRGRQWIRRDINASDPEGEAARHALWWPPTKVAGRYLSSFLARIDPGASEAAVSAPAGEPVELDLTR